MGCDVRRLVAIGVLLALSNHVAAQDARHTKIIGLIDAQTAHFGDLSRQIWEIAEPGYKETKSAALLAGELRQAGFRVRENIVGIPTAFIADWGAGKPAWASTTPCLGRASCLWRRGLSPAHSVWDEPCFGRDDGTSGLEPPAPSVVHR
jgi:hypothetical protein